MLHARFPQHKTFCAQHRLHPTSSHQTRSDDIVPPTIISSTGPQVKSILHTLPLSTSLNHYIPSLKKRYGYHSLTFQSLTSRSSFHHSHFPSQVIHQVLQRSFQIQPKLEVSEPNRSVYTHIHTFIRYSFHPFLPTSSQAQEEEEKNEKQKPACRQT